MNPVTGRSDQRRRTLRIGSVALALLAGTIGLAGCAPSATPAASADSAEPAGEDRNLEICSELVEQDPPFGIAMEAFVAYSTERASVTQQDIEAAIEHLEDLGAGAHGGVEAGMREMDGVLTAIRDRFVSGSEVDPVVDYAAFQDGANEVIDACEALI